MLHAQQNRLARFRPGRHPIHSTKVAMCEHVFSSCERLCQAPRQAAMLKLIPVKIDSKLYRQEDFVMNGRVNHATDFVGFGYKGQYSEYHLYTFITSR